MDEWFLGIVLLSVLFRFDAVWLLAGIRRQQTIFMIHLRFLVQRFDGSMVRWFHSMVICDCSAVQSAVCLAAAPVFLLGATRHFVLLSCKICAEIVVYRMLAVFLNGLNGKNSSRRIVRNIFSVYFFYSGFKISYSEYCFVRLFNISVIRIVSYIILWIIKMNYKMVLNP